MARWQGSGVELIDFLAERWHLTVDRLEVLDGGMNSQTWLVVSNDTLLVAKSVDRTDSGFASGLELAARLTGGGLTTGAPIPSRGSRLVERWADRQLAVLEFVDGIALAGTPEDQALIGRTLARVHEISRAPAGELGKWFDLIMCFDAYLDLEPWIRPAVEGALDGVRALGELTWAGLHGDPSPDAFFRQPDGEIALIDWGSFMTAPLLYDLASAVMYAGAAEHIVPAYLTERPDMATEVQTGLSAFWRFRQAVQASYFAWRISTNVQTGATPENTNEKGLTDARRGLTGR